MHVVVVAVVVFFRGKPPRANHHAHDFFLYPLPHVPFFVSTFTAAIIAGRNKKNFELREITFNGGSLGSCIDEERS